MSRAWSVEVGKQMFGLSLFRPSRQSNPSFKYPLPRENKVDQMPCPRANKDNQIDVRLSASYARLSCKHDARWQNLIYFVTAVTTNTVHLAWKGGIVVLTAKNDGL